ncbi:very low-density lipoprotein receptor-like isoform X2 [Nematostella vectensis]|uniref:very low-density lipoprotein receptor-like isoform X2 n=1 Tax=Nematostella vectensis TaxID=45351 RepID=UPI0020772CA0|nr:very low-density lipoprotein receptor-like isoform X2 [Nematostella vectensis]
MTGSSVKFFLWFLLEALVVDALKLEAKDSSSLCKICMCRNSEVDCIAKNIQHVRREDIPRGTRYLYLSENPIVCDCALAELLRHSKLKVKGACANGQHIGKDLALLRYEDFDCEMSRERHRRETEITQCIPGTLNCVPITCGGNNFWLPLATYWGCCKGQVHDLRKSFCESVQGTIVCIAADFQCRNQHCLPTQWVCNGQNDCQDGSDEIGCEGCKNVADSFRCRNKRCIPASRVCDTYNDCGDGSDETFCRWKDGSGWCGVHDFRCANDRCTHLSNVCNDRDDCGDASDEAGCVAKTTTSCEDGWSYYNGRCYKVVIKPSTWAHAQSACRSNDSHLIKITSFGLDYFTQSLSSHISMFWIGLSRSNGAFRWTDGEKLGSFANWAIGSPVMDAGTDCVAMVNLTIVSKTWRNQDCGLKLGYVCDKGGTLQSIKLIRFL